MKDRYDIKKDGFCGRWFEGTTNRDKVVIAIPGTGTAEENMMKLLGYIPRAGFSMLVIGHSVWNEDLPSDPIQVPLDYVEKAIALLKQNGFNHFAMFGVSFGARYDLICASMFKDIEVVISAAPYDYITESVKGITKPLNCSTITYRGKDLPYIDVEILHHNLLGGYIKLLFAKGYGTGNMMRWGYNSCIEEEKARVHCENITADVLLLAPAVDDCWPSDVAVPRIEKRIKEAGKVKRLKTVIYPQGSHIIALDLDATPDRKKKMQSMLTMEKKNPAACDKARQDSMKEVIDFLNEWDISG